jgi:molecular chaperone IbpA
VKENTLTISGKRSEPAEVKSEILHQGIAARSFERRYQLADYVQVEGASLENGLLHVDLKREVPEAMKPRTIAIKAGSGPRTIEGKKAA